MLDLQNKLYELYIKLADMPGDSPETADICYEIGRLEGLLYYQEVDTVNVEPELINYCGSPGCNGSYCWECAAIRGGCPEDV
jgi:hypothetical protein